MTRRRRQIAARYDSGFAEMSSVQPLSVLPGVDHAWHLYVIRLVGAWADRRDEVFAELRGRGILVNVHYLPVYEHAWYRRVDPSAVGSCPVADQLSRQIISLPMYTDLTDDQVDRVIATVGEILR